MARRPAQPGEQAQDRQHPPPPSAKTMASFMADTVVERRVTRAKSASATGG